MKSPHAPGPSSGLASSATRAVGRPLSDWVDVSDRGGLSSSSRFTAVTAGGRSVFVKSSGPDPGYFGTATEIRAYESFGRRPWLAAMVGNDFGDAQTGPVLVLEDLTDCTWPPPWSNTMIEAVQSTIASIAKMEVPPWVPEVERLDPEFADKWVSVVDRSNETAATGLWSRGWAPDHLEVLAADATRFDRRGTAVCHLDLWSDNVCARRTGEIVVTDWTDVCLANPALMTGIWASQTCAEAGLRAEDLMPDDVGLAAFLIGLGLDRLVNRPRWMTSQGEQLVRRRLSVLLPYAARRLGLPDPLPEGSG